MANITVNVISDTNNVFDILQENGVIPKPIPENCNTLITEIIIEKKAALLIQQKGFTCLENEKEDDVNGLSLAIADTMDLDLGRQALLQFKEFVFRNKSLDSIVTIKDLRNKS